MNTEFIQNLFIESVENILHSNDVPFLDADKKIECIEKLLKHFLHVKTECNNWGFKNGLM
jgi:hypothetical protein